MLVDRARFLSLGPPSQVVPVRIGQTEIAEFTIRNDHPWRSASIEFVKAHCGCFRVGEFPKELAPGESAKITLRIFILPTGERVNNTLRVHLVGGGRLEADITADPIAPFAGWPERAAGSLDETSRTMFIDVHSEYLDAVTLVQGFTPDGTSVETIFDPELGTIALVDPGDQSTLSVTFQTEDGESTWTGELVELPG